MEEEDFHNYSGRLESQLRILKETRIAESNKERILDYYHYTQARGLSLSRMFRSVQRKTRTITECPASGKKLKPPKVLLKEAF